MKKLISCILILSVLAPSCTRTIYTTSQTLEKLQTKDDIIRRFGLPTQKRSEGDITEWIYDYGTSGTRVQRNIGQVNANVRGSSSSVYGNATSSGTEVTTFSDFNRYVKFTFNSEGSVIHRNYVGVDLSVKKTSVGKTILCVLGLVAVLAGAYALAMDSDPMASY